MYLAGIMGQRKSTYFNKCPPALNEREAASCLAASVGVGYQSCAHSFLSNRTNRSLSRATQQACYESTGPSNSGGALQFSNTVTALADAMYPYGERGPPHQDIPEHMLSISCRHWCLADQTSVLTDCSKVAFDPIEPIACLALRTCEVVGMLGPREAHHEGAPRC
jgi:hypothetical protein